MGRTQRALTSLVAAIPAGFLAYSLVMVFLNRADSLTTIMQLLVGVTLACAALVTLMPFGLLIFSGKKSATADDGKAAASRASVEDDIEAAEGVEMAEGADVEEVDDEASDAFDIDDSDADVMADSDDEISGPASSMDELDSVDFDDDEDEEKPAPKKRKK